MLDQVASQSRSNSSLVEKRASFSTEGEAYDLDTVIELMGTKITVRSNVEIYAAADAAVHLYKLVEGAVRTYKVINDGRRQIAAFYLPGDIFGLEVGNEYVFSAEAICDCKMLMIKRKVIADIAATNNAITRDLWNTTALELDRAQNHVALLIKSAVERVVDFLLEMSKRSVSSRELDLSMTRQDIADYLGLTIETVSRALNQLQETEMIEIMKARHIVVRNHDGLRRMNA